MVHLEIPDDIQLIIGLMMLIKVKFLELIMIRLEIPDKEQVLMMLMGHIVLILMVQLLK